MSDTINSPQTGHSTSSMAAFCAPADRPKSLAIPGGVALLGTNSPVIVRDIEGPLRRKKVKPFRLGETTITNAQFAQFIKATGYLTDAERLGSSFVFWSHVAPHITHTQGVVGTEWWRQVEGANWRDINGPGSAETAWLPDHPVVHVSQNDASRYAEWVGGRLPNEVEWEHAARGGLGDVIYPWGDAAADDDNVHRCNVWQGQFPQENLCLDGYDQTAPAKSFPANGYGLYNMIGNVWEWTREPFVLRSSSKEAKAQNKRSRGLKLVKGGSFLCHQSHCYRYRIAARIGNTADTTMSHTGFRVMWPD